MSKGMFKTSFMGGFKKGDVLSYIDEMDKMSREYEGKLHAEVEDLKKSLDSTNTLKTDFDSGFKKTEFALSTATKRLAELEEEKITLENEINNNNIIVLQKNLEIDNLRNENFSLQQQLNVIDAQSNAKDEELITLKQQNEHLIKKTSDFSKIEEQIAWVMLAARKSADTMIEDAKSDTENLKQDAYNKLSELTVGVNEFNTEIASFREKTKYFYDVSDDMLDSIYQSSKQLGINISSLSRQDDKLNNNNENLINIKGTKPTEVAEDYREIF
jgi:chromosome segregation ATPase